MIRDLLGTGRVDIRADVLVIGAGTVGLVLATELAAMGKRVVCLESGGRVQEADTHPLNATEQTGTPYSGAEHGRFRCLGGTSTRWGGALIPFQEPDLKNAEWPVRWEELAPYVSRVEALFGLASGTYDAPDIRLGESFFGRQAKWPTFGKRNVYSLLRHKADAADGPEIWIHATAIRFRIESGTLRQVTAEAEDGSSITVTAAETVIAAGAIESTRLLLLIAQQNPGALTGKHLGEGFHDHLSAVIAELKVVDRSKLNRMVGFSFSRGGGMRNLRFELTPTTPLRSQLPPCFAHIGFSDTEGGFSALRDLFRALQKRQAPSLAVLSRLMAGLPWLTRAVWWRYLHRRLLFPADARIEVHMVIEQSSTPQNKIELSDHRKDRFGQPLSRLSWAVGPGDIEDMERCAADFERSWANSAMAQIAEVVRRPTGEVSAAMSAGGGIYHPGGSTRMAAEAENGPIDRDLRVFGVRNLAVCATSVLPTSGGANPTMMLLLLAMRYLDQAKPQM